MAVRYYINLPSPGRARGSDPAFSFSAQGADEFAAQLQDALNSSGYFERWRLTQPEPDEVDVALGVTDAQAQVSGQQKDLQIVLIATTSVPGQVLKHRLRLLAGSGWELRDVSAA
jgi:hypothetical protein